MSDLLDGKDISIDHVTTVTSRLANNINRMEFIFEQYITIKIAERFDVSGLVDTDYAQSFLERQRVQVVFESAMAVHSTMVSNSLLDDL